MKNLSSSFLMVGGSFVAGGLISIVGGALAMFRFLVRPETDDDVFVGDIARGMILPHIFMFLGVGVVTYGVILIAKGYIIAKRSR
jgi:hypothetical protein